MDGKRREEILEIYKLHAELADRVSQRRLGANRIYVSLLVGLMLFCGALLKIGGRHAENGPAFFLVGVVGALLAVSWLLVARSYKQLNSGKFKALRELEKELPFGFFEREWHFLGQGKDRKKYLKLSKVEQTVPWVFLALSLAVVIFGITRW